MQSRKLGIITMALTFAALAGISPAMGSSSVQNSKVNTIKKDRQAPKPIDIKGGMKMFAGYGIPPHIYGMHYVRRGTHKRTNK